MRALSPLRFQFSEGDRERYGDGWHVYDEAALTRLPAGDVVDLEKALKAGLGCNLPEALNAIRRGDTTGDLIAMYITRWLAGERAPLAEFNPLVLLVEWEPGEEPAEAGDADPPASTSSTTSEESAPS